MPFPHSWVINGYVTRITQQVPLVEKEHMSSSPVFSGVRVDLSLVFCIMFCRSLFVLLSIFIWPLNCLSLFDLRVLIPSLYLQTLFNIYFCWGSYCRVFPLCLFCCSACIYNDVYVSFNPKSLQTRFSGFVWYHYWLFCLLSYRSYIDDLYNFPLIFTRDTIYQQATTCTVILT